jgi:hypothetical protein
MRRQSGQGAEPEIHALIPAGKLTRAGFAGLPAMIARAGERTAWRFLEFFTANIRNRKTRLAYAQAIGAFFHWCEWRHVALEQIHPTLIAVYLEQHPGSVPTVKQHLAAIRMLFDWLVVGQIVAINPASSVRGPTYVVHRGKTPVLTADQARALLDSIDTKKIVGLRDRALLGVMCYTFSRVRSSGFVTRKEEEGLSGVFSFISPGAHVAVGNTEGRLLRFIGVSAMLEAHLGPHQCRCGGH